MLKSSRHRFVLFHIPKTGGSSVTAALAPFLDSPKPVRIEHGWQARHHVGGMHCLPSEATIPSGYAVVCTLRDPLSRFVSLWSNPLRNPGRKIDPEEFVGTCMSLIYGGRGRRQDRVFWPQSRWVPKGTNVRFLCFERLQETFDQVFGELGLPHVELPHHNQKSHPDWRTVYEEHPGLEHEVLRLYKTDVELYWETFGEGDDR